MKIVRGFQTLTQSIPHPVVTIGNFDGVHLGHQRIIELVIEKARARNGQSVAYTFRPHPQVALWPGSSLQLLSTYDEKLELLLGLGLDWVIEEPFSRKFSETEPAQFFTEILLKSLGAEVIIVGYDFAFGKGRHGHLASLENFCRSASVELIVVPPQRVSGVGDVVPEGKGAVARDAQGFSDAIQTNELVSSSRIRQLLLVGEVERANQLLGRKFSYCGTVIKGDGRGKQIGFPTANLKLMTLENKVPLPFGVYVTETKISATGKIFPSVTNVGLRPTFQTASSDEVFPALVEAHLLDTAMDLYGASIEVSFLRRLREEKKILRH